MSETTVAELIEQLKQQPQDMAVRKLYLDYRGLECASPYTIDVRREMIQRDIATNQDEVIDEDEADDDRPIYEVVVI